MTDRIPPIDPHRNARAFLDACTVSMQEAANRMRVGARRVLVAAPIVSKRAPNHADGERITSLLVNAADIVERGPVAQLEQAISLSHEGFKEIKFLADECESRRAGYPAPSELEELEELDARLRDSLSRVGDVPVRSMEIAIEVERLASMVESDAGAEAITRQTNVAFRLIDRYLEWQPTPIR